MDQIKSPLSPRYLPAASLVFMAMLLTACGGGGGGGLTSDDRNKDEANKPFQISGTVMDGYIKGAKVCLDTNTNLQCDDAISTTTGDNGSYSLTIPRGVDASKYHVVVDIVVGAIDSDNPGTPIATAYTLLAPATDAKLVTPLSTFVSHNMIAVPSLSVQEAKVQTLSSLNLPPTTDLAKDYIAAKDRSTQQIAQMAATVLAQSNATVREVAAPSNAAEEIQAIKRALKEAQVLIARYALSAASASDISAVKEQAKEAIKTRLKDKNTNIKNDIQQQAAIGDGKPAKFMDLIISGGVFNFTRYSSFEPPSGGTGANTSGTNSNTSGTNSSVGSIKLEINQTTTDGNKLITKTFNALKKDSAWTAGRTYKASGTNSIYSKTLDRWVANNDQSNGSFVENSDGLSGTWTDDATKNSMKVGITVLDVSGKKASQIPGLLDDDDYACGGTACGNYVEFEFPAGSQIINYNNYVLDDIYSAYECTGCALNYYEVVNSTYKTTEFASLEKMIERADGKATAHTSDKARLIYIGEYQAKLSPSDSTSGTVTFLFMKYDFSTKQSTFTEVGKGSYSISTVGGNRVLVVRATSEATPGTLIGNNGGVSSYQSAYTFVEMNSKIFTGRLTFKGLGTTAKRPSLNRVAMDAFVSAQGFPAIK